MKILVTGGGGYLGSVLVRHLLDHGLHVRALDNLLHRQDSLQPLQGTPGFDFLRGDVRDAATVDSALEGVDAVVHLAAIVGDPACARQPELAVEVNREASIQLFEMARGRGVDRFVFASTCSNYGRMASAEYLAVEGSELKPVSLYAETKVTVERELLRNTAGESIPVVTLLRFATLYGLSPRMRFDLTVNEFTMELLTRRELVVYGEQFWRPYLHVNDAARAIHEVLRQPASKEPGLVLNVGDSSENYRKGTLVEMIVREIGQPLRIEKVQKIEDPRDYRVSFEKIKKLLGFTISRRVEDGIREVREAVEAGQFEDPSHERYRN